MVGTKPDLRLVFQREPVLDLLLAHSRNARIQESRPIDSRRGQSTRNSRKHTVDLVSGLVHSIKRSFGLSETQPTLVTTRSTRPRSIHVVAASGPPCVFSVL